MALHGSKVGSGNASATCISRSPGACLQLGVASRDIRRERVSALVMSPTSNDQINPFQVDNLPDTDGGSRRQEREKIKYTLTYTTTLQRRRRRYVTTSPVTREEGSFLAAFFGIFLRLGWTGKRDSKRASSARERDMKEGENGESKMTRMHPLLCGREIKKRRSEISLDRPYRQETCNVSRQGGGKQGDVAKIIRAWRQVWTWSEARIRWVADVQDGAPTLLVLVLALARVRLRRYPPRRVSSRLHPT